MAAASVRMVMTASALRASSAGVAAAAAPAAVSRQRLQFVGGAVPHRQLVPNLDQPLRDGRAHFADPGDSDLHRDVFSLWPSPTLQQRAATIRDYARARKSALAAPLGHIELERGSRRRVASAARLIGTEARNGERQSRYRRPR